MSTKAIRFKVAASLAVAAGFALTAPLAALAQNTIVEETKTLTLCDDLFAIDANADKKTAKERHRIIQANLDNALLMADDLRAEAVKVRRVNDIPVVELDGFHIVTADANSAKRNRMTREALAKKWADKLRFCLAKKKVVKNYIARLQGVQKKKQVAIKEDKTVAVVKPETKMPIHMITKFEYDGTTIGDPVTALLSKDFPLPPKFNTYIPKGSLVHGRVVDSEKHTYNGYPKKNSVTIDFHSIELPNGQDIPIQAHVVGGENEFIAARPSKQKDVDTTLDAGKKPSGTEEGVITGAWLGASLNKSEAARLPRLVMDKGSVFNIKPTEQLQIETTATTAISIASPKLANASQ